MLTYSRRSSFGPCLRAGFGPLAIVFDSGPDLASCVLVPWEILKQSFNKMLNYEY